MKYNKIILNKTEISKHYEVKQLTYFMNAPNVYLRIISGVSSSSNCSCECKKYQLA